jgi:hypothetical protein
MPYTYSQRLALRIAPEAHKPYYTMKWKHKL